MPVLTLLRVLEKQSVFSVRWFWAPFFEHIVFALGVFVIPSVFHVYLFLRSFQK